MKELTKAEEQIMQYLWKIEKGFLKDILLQCSEPKPAHNTVSTVMKALISKGFVSFETYGKMREYTPIVKKSDYFQRTFKGLVKSYFNNSVKRFASFFAGNNELSLEDLHEIKQIIDEQIKKAENK